MNISTSSPAVPSPFFITATIPSVSLSLNTETFAPLTPTPTIELFDGITTAQVNVRGEPSTASAPLGTIAPSTHIQIIGRDPSSNWVQIIYPPSSTGKGWLTVQYINVKNPDAIPVIGIAIGSTPGVSGAIIQQVNVRSGPGTDFNTLGILNPKDAVTLTGKDASGIWLQIQFSSGPDGKGWVTAAYVQASGLEALPIVGQTGVIVGTGTPTVIPPIVTPTIVAAPQDNDSAKIPAINVTFSPTGTKSLIYSSSVSTPKGDSEDWVQFTPYSTRLLASLTCLGNGKLNVELLQNGKQVQNWGRLICGETIQLNLSSDQHYLMHLVAIPEGPGLENINFTLRIESLN